MQIVTILSRVSTFKRGSRHPLYLFDVYLLKNKEESIQILSSSDCGGWFTCPYDFFGKITEYEV